MVLVMSVGVGIGVGVNVGRTSWCLVGLFALSIACFIDRLTT